MKPAELKRWRAEHQMTQQKLADTLGIDIMTVSRWERGLNRIPTYLDFTLAMIPARKTGRKKLY